MQTTSKECQQEAVTTVAFALAPGLLDIQSAYALSCSHRQSLLNETEWRELAHAYVARAGFWESAALRLTERSRPLATWREELRRLVLFQSECERALGERLSMDDIMASWQH